jgi:hypothetical protein
VEIGQQMEKLQRRFSNITASKEQWISQEFGAGMHDHQACCPELD